MKKRIKKIPPIRFLKKVDSRIIWCIIGVFTLALAVLFYFYPLFTELVYSNGIFVAVRWVFDNTLGMLPFSVFYALIAYILFKWIYKLFRWVRFNLKLSGVSIIEKVKYTGLSFLAYISKIIFFFFFLWGFNYFRISVEEKMGLDVKNIEQIDLFEEANYARKKAIEARKEMGIDNDYSITHKDLPENLEETVRVSLEKVLKSIRYNSIGKVRVRYIRPDGFLKSIGVTGFYNPFLAEANLDRDFSALYLPFLMAHEMVHGYGFGDEGTANFLAYLTCENSNTPIIRYSGRISYLLYLSYHLEPLRIKFNPAIRKDLSEHGVFSSQPQYDRMIRYISAWRRKYKPN